MSKAALLIDWENLLGRLGEDPWWVADPAPLIQPIVTAVQKRTDNMQPVAPLQYKGYFLQAGRSVSPEAGKVLAQLGFHRTDSTFAKNSADARLIVKAIRLQLEGYTRFFILTGDEDFADLAIELENEGAQAFLWPVDRTRLRGPIQDWPRKEYVADAIGLEAGTPPTADELDQFLLYLQRLIDDGSHMGTWRITLNMVCERFGITDQGRAAVLWGQVQDAGYIWEGKELVGGQSRYRRRIKYEHPKVQRLLNLADAIIDQIAHDHGSCERGKLLAIIPGELHATYPALLEMLVASKHLTMVGPSVSTASRAASLGMVRPLRRMILSTWHQSLVRPKREGVAPGVLAKRWVRHATRGGKNVKREDEDRHLKDGRDVIKRAEAAGALLRVGGSGDAPFGFVVNDGHPLVSDTKRIARAICELLPADGSMVARPAVNEQIEALSQALGIGATNSDRRFWLGALASEQIVRIFDGKVGRSRNSPLATRRPG